MAETIKGMDALVRKLKSIDGLQAAKRGIKSGALHIKGKIAKYPSASEANMPNSRRWYQRGYGPKWKLKDGTVHGRKTSETLSKRWTTEERNGGLTQVVGNNASYAIYVQGEEQAAFHEKRGWNTAEDIVDREGSRVLTFVKNEVDKALEK